MIRDGVRLTKTEVKIYAILQDGHGHRMGELLPCLEDEFASPDNLSNHIARMRKKLKRGYDIIAQSQGRYSFYRVIRSLYDDE